MMMMMMHDNNNENNKVEKDVIKRHTEMPLKTKYKYRGS